MRVASLVCPTERRFPGSPDEPLRRSTTMASGVRGIARAAGAARKAAAIIQGRIGILATLSKEHGEVAALLGRAQKTKDDDRGQEQRRHLFQEIRQELLSHAVAEERTLYDRMQGLPKTRERAIHGAEEHSKIEALVEELSMVDPANDEWPEVCRELADMVRHHVHEEEHELFPMADDAFSTTELEQIDEEFKREKHVLREKLHDAAE
jgi:hemerythrin superfamily protein